MGIQWRCVILGGGRRGVSFAVAAARRYPHASAAARPVAVGHLGGGWVSERSDEGTYPPPLAGAAKTPDLAAPPRSERPAGDPAAVKLRLNGRRLDCSRPYPEGVASWPLRGLHGYGDCRGYPQLRRGGGRVRPWTAARNRWRPEHG